jgi:hypothetical protein
LYSPAFCKGDKGVGTLYFQEGKPCSVNQFTHNSVFLPFGESQHFRKSISATMVSGLRMQNVSALCNQHLYYSLSGKTGIIFVFYEFYIWKTLLHHFDAVIFELLSTTIISPSICSKALCTLKTHSSKKVADVIVENDYR